MKNLAIITLLMFAGFVRIYQLESYPPSLNWDEVSHGYNAFSILQTGKDEWGFSYPLLFRAYGDYKLPVYIYSLVPFIAVGGGLGELIVRLPSALSGVFLVFFIYKISLFLLKSHSAALISGFVVSISPWTFFVSRMALEANLALSLITAGVYYFLKSTQSKNAFVTSFSFLLFAASVWTYNSARVFMPLFFLVLIGLYKKAILSQLRQKNFFFLLSLIVLLVSFLGMFLQLSMPHGSARYSKVSIIDQGAINKIENLRNSHEYPEILERFIFNRPVYFLTEFSKNYMDHFSYEYLFAKGGDNYQFSVLNHGLLYPLTMPLFVFGFLFLFFEKKYKLFFIFLTWLLLAPIAASITRESPHVLRNIIFSSPIYVLVGAGFLFLLNLKLARKGKIFAVVLVTYLVYFAAFVPSYINHTRKYSWAWQHGYKQAVNFAIQNYDKYEKIVFTKKYGEPHEFVLFYAEVDPKDYQNDKDLIRFQQSDWYWVDRFDKFYFINDWDIKHDTDIWKLESGLEIKVDRSVLLITSPGNYPADWEKRASIYFLDGKKAFDIVEK